MDIKNRYVKSSPEPDVRCVCVFVRDMEHAAFLTIMNLALLLGLLQAGLVKLAVRRLELRREKLEKDRHNAERVECPLLCGQFIRRDGVVRHTEMHCIKRVVMCTLGCGEEMTFEARVAHEEQECVCRLARCPNVYSGCMVLIPVKNLKEHATLHCKKRFVQCKKKRFCAV